MNKYLQLIIIFCCLISYSAYAQVIVKGTISDQDGHPVVGATVLEKGTNNGVVSDLDGNYQISVNPNATLRVRFVGFNTEELPVNGRTIIDVKLIPNLEALSEVVVTALGFKEQKDEIGYANSTLASKQVVQAAEPNLVNSLSGLASGVRINRNSGDPGAGAYIQIRGNSTITRDNQPLIVIDGVPISNDNRGTNQIAQQSRLNDINPNDIESMTILKGASAAALWGTQALGGAIIITTKNGNFNQELKVSLRTSYSVDQINRRHPLQNKFGQGNAGVFNPTARDSWGDKISERSGAADDVDTNGAFFVDQVGNVYYPTINKNSQETFVDENFDQVFQTGHFLENSLSMSSGTEKGTYFFSISDLDQEGIIRNNSDYRRSTVRLNTEQLLNKSLTLNANVAYTRTSSKRIRAGAQSSGLYLGLLRTPADFNNIGYRGEYYSGPDASPIPNRHRSYRRYLGNTSNPVYNNPSWTTNEQEDIADLNRFINMVKLTYAPTNWLEFIGRVGLDTYTEEKTQFFTPGSASGAFRTGLFEREIATNTIFNMDYIARATKSFGSDFNGSLLVGFNYNQRQLKVSGNEIVNFIQFADVDGSTRDMDNASPEDRVIQSTIGEQITAGLYSQLSFNAYESLFFTGTVRVESASTFGSESGSVFAFPSASLAWQFSDLLETSIISFGKLRGSYGEVGVQPQRYRTTTEIVQPSYSDEWGGDLNVGLYGGGGFTRSVNVGNPFLKPERKKEFEVGTDLRFLNDRLSLSATYFQNKTEDVLLDFPIANTRGYDEVYNNGAEIANKGLEIDLGYLIYKNNDFSLSTSALFTKIENEVTDLNGVETVNLGGLSAVSARAIEGQPLGVLFGSRSLRDDQGNIVFDENGFPRQDEKEGVIGDPNPEWQGSLSLSARYKNLSLSVLFETYQGADIYAGTESVLYNLGTAAGSAVETTASQNLLDYNGAVIPTGTTFRGVVRDFGAGPVALTEPWYLGDGGFFSNGNDELYVQDGSWSRLRQVILTYRLQNNWVEKIGFNNIEVSATGRNLFLWTGFKGNDPDTNLEGVSAARGIEYFNNPSTRSYVFTVQLDF